LNRMKSWFLLGLLTVLLVLLGSFIGGKFGSLLFFTIAMAMNFIGYFFSDKIAIKMTGSRPASEGEYPGLYSMVRRLSHKAGIPMPKVYITPSEQPNAFATGRSPNHAAVAVTEGIMRILNDYELEGVIAHELAHIKNRDVLLGTIAAALAGAITMMADAFQWASIFGLNKDEEEGGGPGIIGGIAIAIIASIAATIIQLAISRSREYMADASGAQIAGRTDGLANALLKLESAAHQIPMQVSPATSHLFIVNPLSGASSLMKLFSTHPPIKERVEKLSRMRITR